MSDYINGVTFFDEGYQRKVYEREKRRKKLEDENEELQRNRRRYGDMSFSGGIYSNKPGGRANINNPTYLKNCNVIDDRNSSYNDKMKAAGVLDRLENHDRKIAEKSRDGVQYNISDEKDPYKYEKIADAKRRYIEKEEKRKKKIGESYLFESVTFLND